MLDILWTGKFKTRYRGNEGWKKWAIIKKREHNTKYIYTSMRLYQKKILFEFGGSWRQILSIEWNQYYYFNSFQYFWYYSLLINVQLVIEVFKFMWSCLSIKIVKENKNDFWIVLAFFFFILHLTADTWVEGNSEKFWVSLCLAITASDWGTLLHRVGVKLNSKFTFVQKKQDIFFYIIIRLWE